MAKHTPNNPGSPGQIAAQHMQAGRLQEAEAIYRQLLAEHPVHHEALFNMGILLNHQRNFDEAIGYLCKVLELTPDMVEAHINLGNVYHQKRDFPLALVCFQQALSLRPRSFESHNNVGNVLKEQGDFTGALSSYQKALALKPGSAIIFNNIGETYRSMGRVDEATTHFRKALAVKPDFAQAQWNLSQVFLLAGDFSSGLPLFEKRLASEVLRQFGAIDTDTQAGKFSDKPRWKGENLQGKTLVIWAEQGYGDNLMMMRYLPLLKEKGATSVIIYCYQKLMKIMLTQINLVVEQNTPLALDSFDVQCPMMSLPYVFGTTLDSIPQTIPYLSVPAATSTKWRSQLEKFKGMKVGLVWAGNKDLQKDALRSIILQQFAPLMVLDGVQYVSLQKDEAARQLMEKDWRILDWMDVCDDFLDTAALIDNLDLVIAVDTAVAHLAGALGKPVWLLNRLAGDWRWMKDREDSPWYPSMRIFRQTTLHDWSGVIEAVTSELGKLASSSKDGAAKMSASDWEKAVATANQALAVGKK
ncbi:MAG TPA: tetratricopeptide repeat protein, partial [Burkholderiaceae bacterium]|nr:tetratricopeptide repeat protein [Burkholderiaceae bacterium]